MCAVGQCRRRTPHAKITQHFSPGPQTTLTVRPTVTTLCSDVVELGVESSAPYVPCLCPIHALGIELGVESSFSLPLGSGLGLGFGAGWQSRVSPEAHSVDALWQGAHGAQAGHVQGTARAHMGHSQGTYGAQPGHIWGTGERVVEPNHDPNSGLDLHQHKPPTCEP